MSSQASHYSMIIEWSDEDQAFLVTLPEWAEHVYQPVTHGSTYEEAVKNGREVLEMLIEHAAEDGTALPTPKRFVGLAAS